MKHKLTALLLALLALAGPALPVMAEDSATVHIGSAQEFLDFAESCAYDGWSVGKTVILDQDISLAGADYRPAAQFAGRFEGNGHSISGLRLTESLAPAGLFGTILPGGEVRGLTVEGTVAPSGDAEQVGGIAGWNQGVLANCTFAGTVRGNSKTGGICGENDVTGAVRLCDVNGGIFGTSMTGGVAGFNAGTIQGSANRAYVNTARVDPGIELTELGGDLAENLRRVTSPDTYNVATDTGGVAGCNEGVLSGCRNYGTVGYQHIGYNVGGVAGRSSGHISACTNFGEIEGRRSVGGIVGLAEPYVIRRFSENSLDAVRQELDALTELVDQSVGHADGVSETISNRLTAVGDSLTAAGDRARDMTDSLRDYAESLTGSLTDFANSTVDEVNRGSEILSTTLPMLSDAVDGLKTASGTLTDAIESLRASIEEADRSGGLDALKDATSDFTDASGAARELADDLDNLAQTLKEGGEDISAGVDELSGTIRPKDGISQTEWQKGTDAALGEIAAGNHDMAEGMKQFASGAGVLADEIRALNTLREDPATQLELLSALYALETEKQALIDSGYTEEEADAILEETLTERLEALDVDPVLRDMMVRFWKDWDASGQELTPTAMLHFMSQEITREIAEGDMIAGLHAAAAGLSRVSEGIDTIYTTTEFDLESARRGMDLIRQGIDTMTGASLDIGTGVFDGLEAGLNDLARALDAAGGLSAGLQESAAGMRDAARELTSALDDTQKVLDYLNGQEKLSFDSLERTEYDDRSGDFYDALRDVSNQMELLNAESKGSSDTLLADLRRINAQFNALMDAFLGVTDEIGDIGDTEIVEDASDQDIEGAVSGKVILSVNHGEVNGDISVGGIAGSMDIYNELNPENDEDLNLSNLVHRSYQLKCILQDCTNRGAVCGKKDNTGGICGDETLGVVIGCRGYGDVSSESGGNVGGICGRADSLVRGCWTKCSLSGRSAVGGIVGAGKATRPHLRVENCHSMVEIDAESSYTGAISGQNAGTYTGNRFVSDTLAGVNRSSVAGQAEPVSYAEFCLDPELPEEFRSFTLRFVAEDKTLKSVGFHYGDSFDRSIYPEAPAVEGQYPVWDRDTLENLHFDTTVTAIYSTSITALPSEARRSASRPVFFAKGVFTSDDGLDASAVDVDFAPSSEGLLDRLRSYRRTLLEQWELTIPADGALTHEFRYLPPRTASGNLDIYLRDSDGNWTRVPSAETGSYLSFDAQGETVLLSVVSFATPWWVWAIIAVLALDAAVLVAVLLIRKKIKNTVTDEEKVKAAKWKRYRRRILLGLLAGLVLLGGLALAVLRFAPAISRLELYNLLRSYAESAELDMDLTLRTKGGDSDYIVRGALFTTEREGRRISCTSLGGIPFYACDGALLLENGQAFRSDGVLPDYTLLPETAASLFRRADVETSERGGIRTYRAEASSADARRVLGAYLPSFGDAGGGAERIVLELTVTDGEPTMLTVRWLGGEAETEINLALSAPEREHSLPQAVRAALSAKEDRNAPQLDADRKALVLAWAELCAREPLSAEATLYADCGPVLLDDSLRWTMTHALGEDVSRLDRQGSTLYFTDDAAVTDSGLVVDRDDSSVADLPLLLRLACRKALLSAPEMAPAPEGISYTLRLDGGDMRELSTAVAPETAGQDLAFKEGELSLVLSGGQLQSLEFYCSGGLKVIRDPVNASVQALLRFDSAGNGFNVPDAAREVLGI